MDCPFLAVYRASELPDPQRTADLWRREVESAGLKGLFLVRVESHNESGDPRNMGFDSSLEFEPRWSALGRSQIFRRKWWHRHKFGTGEPVFRDNVVYEYEDLVKRALAEPLPTYPRIPCVCPGWDNSPRRKTGAVIFMNSTPERYERWLREIVDRQTALSRVDGNSGISPESLVFINAWNEWAEGNHLEPCQKWGRAYLEATQRALRVIANQDVVSAETRVYSR
jgi:hypothetical protein